MRMDTRGERFPEVKDATFVIKEIPAMADDGVSWKFKFETVIDDIPKNYTERLWPGFLADLLKGLRFKEIEEGVFDFEPAACLDRSVKADVVHQTQSKGKNAGKIFPRMVNIRPGDEIPF